MNLADAGIGHVELRRDLAQRQPLEIIESDDEPLVLRQAENRLRETRGLFLSDRMVRGLERAVMRAVPHPGIRLRHGRLRRIIERVERASGRFLQPPDVLFLQSCAP